MSQRGTYATTVNFTISQTHYVESKSGNLGDLGGNGLGDLGDGGLGDGGISPDCHLCN